MTKTLLHIDASALADRSVSRQISARIVEHLAPAEVIRRDLSDPLPILTQDWIGANFTPADQRSDAHKAQLALSDSMLDEVERAEVIVIGTPMYNFAVPANLKAWLDQIARAGRSFRYTESGPEGLLTGKRVIIAIATGGTAIGSDHDFASGYLRFMLGFLGLTDVSFVTADQLGTPAESKLEAAQAQIARLAA